LRDRSTRPFHLLIPVLLAGLTPLSAQEPAPVPSGGAPAFHARKLGDMKSPAASIEAAAWLAGRWTGTGLGGRSEEIWSPPAGGAMIGAYRLLKEDEPVFYEFMLLVEEQGSLVLKLKHFHPDMRGWEEKDDFVDFPLVAVEPTALHFDGLSFLREGDGSLTIYLLLRDRASGVVREEKFVMRRAE
jgi:hypothetical protein